MDKGTSKLGWLVGVMALIQLLCLWLLSCQIDSVPYRTIDADFRARSVSEALDQSLDRLYAIENQLTKVLEAQTNLGFKIDDKADSQQRAAALRLRQLAEQATGLADAIERPTVRQLDGEQPRMLGYRP